MLKRTVVILVAVAALGFVARPAVTNAQEALEHATSSGLLLPLMSPARGRLLFASKGCVVCHAVNGIGGEDAPAFDANSMDSAMDPFDFAARMWRGAEPMIAMQNEELGAQVEFTGQELADIIAFVHNKEEQSKFSESDIPPKIRKLIK